MSSQPAPAGLDLSGTLLDIAATAPESALVLAAGAPSRADVLTLVGCQPLVGHLPGFRQPALLTEFVLSQRGPAPEVLAGIDARIGQAFPHYAQRQAPAFVGTHPLLQRLIRLYLALLAQARCPLFNEGEFLGAWRDASGRARVRLALPCLGQDAPWLHALLNSARAILTQPASAGPLPPGLVERATRLATLIAPRGFNSTGLLLAADRRGVPWTRLGDNVVQFGWGARARLLDSTFTDLTPNIGARMARDKLITAATLRRAGLPVPSHMPAHSVEQALHAARRIGWPVVVKPQDSDGGRGVTVGLRDEASLREAFERARAESTQVLVEQHIEGHDYRLQVFQGDVFWAVHRQPGGVTGDGRQTVAQLLAALNADPKRGLKGSGLVLKRIEMNAEAQRLLAEQGLAEHDVPAAGRFVRLRLAANVGNGGTPIPVLAQAHPDNLALGARAARLLRLDLAGIDVLMPDITRSWLETGAAIIEVNAQPQVSPHLHDWLIEQLVPGDGRIPVVGVVAGDGHAFEAIAEAARAAARGRDGGDGRGLGIVGTGGPELGGRRVAKGGGAGFSAQALLADPACSALLLLLDTRQRPSRLLPVDRFDALLFVDAGPPDAAPNSSPNSSSNTSSNTSPGTPPTTPPTTEPGAEPGAEPGPDWIAHAAVLASVAAEVWIDPAAAAAWRDASTTWARPAQRLSAPGEGLRRVLARLAGAPAAVPAP